MSARDVTLWHTLTVDDAPAMMAWLSAVGFTEHATYRSAEDPSVVEHAEWLWPGGGGIMFGSRRPGGFDLGPASAYLVTDDVDGVVARAVEGGGTVQTEVVSKEYGGRGGAVTDPEGNTWSVGDYQPQ